MYLGHHVEEAPNTSRFVRAWTIKNKYIFSKFDIVKQQCLTASLVQTKNCTKYFLL